jgi:hypothetical protein
MRACGHAEDVRLEVTPGRAKSRWKRRVDSDAQSVIDVDESGDGTLPEPRMYRLVRPRGPSRRRTFEVTWLAQGVRAYVFTLGRRRISDRGSPIVGRL